MDSDPDTTSALREHPDARLLDYGAALDAAVDLHWRLEDLLRDGSEATSACVEASWQPVDFLCTRIVAHPAQTLDGLRVKARALALLGDGEEDVVRRDLVRVLGGVASAGA